MDTPETRKYNKKGKSGKACPKRQYARPEIIGLVLGAFVISMATGEFRSSGGSAPMIRFILGMVIMIGSLMFTDEALKKNKGPVKVLVSEPHQKTNVEKLARSKGKKAVSKAVGSEFEVVIE